MKRKMKGVLGIGLAFVLVVSLMAFALPVLADPDEEFAPEPNEWSKYVFKAGSASDWFIQGAAVDDERIGFIGPIAQSPLDGDLYAYVGEDADTPRDLLKSEDNGRSWATSTSTTKSYHALSGAPIVDMVCSSMDEDVLYVTDGNYVYKSVDGGETFALLAAASLETLLAGLCGCPINNEPITCIDVGYDANDNALVFIGTKVVTLDWPDPDPLDCESLTWTTPASVFFIAEAVYPVEWLDLGLHCYSCGGFTPWAIGATPDFADTGEVMVVVTRPLTIDFYNGVAAEVTITAGLEGGVITYPDLSGTGISYSGGSSPDTLAVDEVTTFSGTAIGDQTFTIEPECDGAWTWEVTSDAGTADICGGTHVVSTIGTYCHWVEQAELLKDCLGPFEIQLASRIGYPDDWSDSETLFVGVVGVYYGDTTSYGGDVYSVTSPSALDLNVAGYSSGCIGLACSTDIISLDVFGEADEASLIAGVYDPDELSYLYYSTDGGWEWDHCDKAPSGMGPTYVLWVGDSAIAATAGCEAAVSLSCGEEVGEYFNQISLIATDIETILDMDHAPGYLSGTSPIFIATECDNCCDTLETYSVWRYDQTYWERVYVSTLTGYTDIDWVQVSPDFDTTMAVFVANSGFDIFWSVDAGCSWKEMRYPCEPKPAISAWVVIDEDTLLCGGADDDAGTIFKTTNHGAGPWKEYEVKTDYDGLSFALSPSIDTDESVLFGDDYGQVFISEDLGEEWDEVVDASAAIFPSDEDTYVIFDPGYGTSGDEGEFMIYAAAGDTIGRCDIDPDAKWSKQDWKAIYSTLLEASGIDAAGDTALYVADRGSVEGVTREVEVEGSFTIEGLTSTASADITITVPVPVVGEIGTFIDGELVMLLGSNFIVTSTTTITGELAFTGVTSDATGTGSIIIPVSGSTPENFTVGEGVIVRSSVLTATVTGAVTVIPSRVVRSLNPMADVSPMKVVFEDLLSGLESDSVLTHPMGSDDLWLTTRSNVLWALDSGNPTYVWVWEDPLATPVIQETPSDGAQLTSTSKVTLEWEELDDADEYKISLYRYCPQCPDEKEPVSVPNSEDTCAIIEGLEAGSTYYWKVRVAEGEPFLSKWSELWEFNTALGEVPDLCSPICGGQDIILTTNFSWDAVSGASGYELQIVAASADGTSDFTGAETLTTDVNALASFPGLDYSTTYYWRVRAVKDGVPGAWSVCIFTTEAPPVVPPEPVPPVEIPPLPAPITPLWIYVIIGIGAALTIAVIVLIVTTRRVP